MRKRFGIWFLESFLAAVLVSMVPLLPATVFAQTGYGDPAVLAKMQEINRQLCAQGLNLAVEAIEFFTIGGERPSARIHQQGFRYVPNDSRGTARGTDITYLVDQSRGATATGLRSDQTEEAIDRAMTTWGRDKSLKKVNLRKKDYAGEDPAFYAFLRRIVKNSGPLYLADIIHTGWWPRDLFDDVWGPVGGDSILAFTVTFIFIDGSLNPTDVNGDHYLDTAFTEIYYNDNFGDPSGSQPHLPWGINVDLPQGIDVETVALHESGHALGLGHFGPPPVAAMNEVYGGKRQTPLPIDDAGLFILWGSWPNP